MAEDKESPPKNSSGRSACTECQRRKQKCNREWPCNHCQKRKVADKCRFKDSKSPPAQELRRKREREVDLSSPDDYAQYRDVDNDDVDSFEALGYAAGHSFAGMKSHLEKKEKSPPKQYLMKVNSCPQLQRALQILPPRPYTDSLVQNFLTSVNCHYYIIYPNSFLQDYQDWWNDRAEGRPLGLQWTCLFLMVCACSTQYISIELQRKLELDLGEPTQRLTEQYHNVARELHSVIPVGNHHLLNVQQLLHSCYWYKSEARFVECWHVLSSAIREAQELGIHQESIASEVPEFEREMHRRVWCVLDTWDWQISALLSRPMLIDRTDCDVGLPSLTLEGLSPSPLLHMKLQSELISQLSKRFGLPKNVVDPADVLEHKAIMEAWMNKFPPTYDLAGPDTSKDTEHPWIILHRHYLRTMAYSMTLDPIRAYLAKPMSKSSSEAELRIRNDGINYSLSLMSALHGFFDHVWPRDAKFHFVIFCIFDTAAVYSSVILHDEDGSAPRQSEMLRAIESALKMVKRLATAIPAAQLYHDILVRLQRKVLKKLEMGKTTDDVPRKRSKGRSKATVQSLSPPAVTQLSEASVPSAELASTDGKSSSPSSSFAYANPQLPVVHTVYPTGHEPPLPHPPPNPGFQPAPFLSDLYGAHGPSMDSPDPPMSNGDGCIADAMPATSAELVQPVEGQIPDMGFSTMSTEDLGELADLWRWQSLDLDLIHSQATG